jgi:hypothetical protein
MQKTLLFRFGLGIMLLLGSCRAKAETTATQSPIADTVSEAEIEAEEAENVPTDTAVPPTNTPAPPTQIPATVPPPATTTPHPTSTATVAPPNVPELVWLPYASGNYGQPVLMLQNGVLSQQELPVDAEIYFDYAAGWLAYGSTFWEATGNQDAVTDLHIYSFVTETDQLWAEQIGRAIISPASSSQQLEVAVAVHNGQSFDLIIMSSSDDAVPLVTDIDPFFSWSPDGSQIAYLRDGDLFITSATANSNTPPIARGIYQNSNWIGDAPIWLGDSGYLLLAETPFIVVAADGSETIVPLDANGNSLDGQRPFTMLYSPTYNQLIAELEGTFGSNVTVYQLGEDFETAVPIQQITDAQLAGWYKEGESVIVVSGGEATVLPLMAQE